MSGVVDNKDVVGARVLSSKTMKLVVYKGMRLPGWNTSDFDVGEFAKVVKHLSQAIDLLSHPKIIFLPTE
jgi:hypothetical protein